MGMLRNNSVVKSIPVKPHSITNELSIYGTDLPGVIGGKSK